MSNLISAAKQALEALEMIDGLDPHNDSTTAWNVAFNKTHLSVEFLRQAIKQAEKQEPDKYAMDIECTKCGAKQSGVLTVHTHPQPKAEQFDHQKAAQNGLREAMNRSQEIAKAAQPKVKQEPVAWMFEFPDKRVAPKFDSAPHGGNWKPLYTHPPVPQGQEPKAEQRCEYCDGTGDVHDRTGEWRGSCVCEASQPKAEIMADAYIGAREDLDIWKKRALEAEELNRKFIAEINGPTHMGEPVPAQPKVKQEPVAWMFEFPDKRVAPKFDSAPHGGNWKPLYTHPPVPQGQEPKAEQDSEFKNFHRQLCERFNYVHDEEDWKRDQFSLIEWIAKEAQPKREPLTDEQLLVLLSKIDEHTVRLPRGFRDFARAIEAAHNIKE